MLPHGSRHLDAKGMVKAFRGVHGWSMTYSLLGSHLVTLLWKSSSSWVDWPEFELFQGQLTPRNRWGTKCRLRACIRRGFACPLWCQRRQRSSGSPILPESLCDWNKFREVVWYCPWCLCCQRSHRGSRGARRGVARLTLPNRRHNHLWWLRTFFLDYRYLDLSSPSGPRGHFHYSLTELTEFTLK